MKGDVNSERLHLSHSLFAVAQYIPFLSSKKYLYFLPFLFTCSPLLMRYAWEHTLCFVLELVFSLSAHSHSVYLCTLLQRAKAAKGHRGGQEAVATTLLTSQANHGSVSSFPGRWEEKQFCFSIKNMTEPLHAPWLLWLPCFTFLLAKDLLLSQC